MKYRFYTKPEYFAELAQLIKETKAGDRIALASMKLDAQVKEVQLIFDELAAAAFRKVDVLVAIDAYAFMMTDTDRPGPLFFRQQLPTRLKPHFEAKREALEKLQAAGGRYVLTNLPAKRFKNPQAARSHIKYTVINDRIYIGSPNLNATEKIEIIAGFDDHKTADYLFGLVQKLLHKHTIRAVLGTNDLRRRIDSETELLIDVGRRGQSLIFQEAMKIIDQARQRLFVACQYFPYGETANHLKHAADRRISVSVRFNHPAKHSWPERFLHYIVRFVERTRQPAWMFSGELPKTLPYVHAKLVASEEATSLGSHNHVTAGVRLGTAEMALLSSDPEFAEMSVAALKRQLNDV